jgi:transposase
MSTRRTLTSLRIEALPVLNAYIDNCALAETFDHFVPSSQGLTIPISTALLFLLRNIMLSGFPLYKLSQWSRLYPGELLGIARQHLTAINDDRVGRSLDQLFLADRATMTTVIALEVIKRYRLQMTSCHNDSTTVTFHGAYHRQPKYKKKAVQLRLGFNKDHRPDLKQIVFDLVVCGDGAVPIHCKLYDGNVTDDTTHRHTWDVLRELVGRTDFVYVADSKLCTKENMAYIAGSKGKFITILPQTRKEYRAFMEWVQEHPIRGKALWYRNPFANNGKPKDHYRGYESRRFVSQEGYRIVWIRSWQKQKLDAEKRKHQLQEAQESLQELNAKLNRYSLKKKRVIRTRVEEILTESKVGDCLMCQIKSVRKRFKKKITRGRPGPRSVYRHVGKTHYELQWSVNEEVVKNKANADGFFPLITNIKGLDMRGILKQYKYQPRLEKRHSYLKSVLEVAPMYLKTAERIEALLFLYYLALVIYALIERDMRQAMKEAGIKSLPIYPEQRECRRPSAERILEAFRNFSKHELRQDDNLEETFFDTLGELQAEVLNLLRIPLRYYRRA